MDVYQFLYIAVAIGAVAILYPTLRDLLKKNKLKGSADEEKSAATNPTVLPLQLQAYERMALYVDRISPHSLIGRLYQPGSSAVDMQIAMVQNIKAEYEYNITQQIYISSNAWDAVRTLKEQTISVINHIAEHLPQDATALELNKKLLEIFTQAGESPAELTAQIINSEAKKLMR